MMTFNIIAGIVTLVSFIASIVIYLEGKRKGSVEAERTASAVGRTRDMLLLANSLAKQLTLLAAVSDREETAKKELKHLALAALSTVEGLQTGLISEIQSSKAWKFGTPSHYFLGEYTDEETGTAEE